MHGLTAVAASVATFGLQGTSASFVSFYPSIRRVGTYSACRKRGNKLLSYNSFFYATRPVIDGPDDVTRRNFLTSLGSAAAFTPLYVSGIVPTQLDDKVTALNGSDEDVIRIAIVGGGIAGISAAHSLATRLLRDNKKVKIVVFEADEHANAPFQENQPPKWTAATARNANSIVPAASMHVMSQRSTLQAIARDTAREWIALQTQSLKQLRSRFPFSSKTLSPLLNIDNFDIVPPYFSINLLKCMGPSVPSEERWTFLTFLKHFVPTSLLTDSKAADERGATVVQLAKANRHLLVSDFEEMGRDPQFNSNLLGVGKGFVSLHRSKKHAEHAVQEANEYEEPAEMLTFQQAVELEPHIENLPITPLYAVHRLNDYTANCLTYMQSLKKRCIGKLGVEFKEQQQGRVQTIERIKDSAHVMKKIPNKRTLVVATAADGMQEAATTAEPKHARFQITTADGLAHEADYIVLAAGVNTPLFARQLGAGPCCPTYPLRGFSLTIHSEGGKGESEETIGSTERPGNLLNRPLSIDSMYVSSVGPNMARLAGYGELVGYRKGAQDVPSVGPRVLSRYGRTLFPEAATCEITTASQCFRPMSPDDLPLVGKVSTVPGLYLHTGHGTLGWTLSMATAECVAQALCDELEGVDDKAQTFDLPNGTTILRSTISPDRFA